WKKNASPIGGATLATYTINPVTTADAGSYTVDVSNGATGATSSAATLTVSTDTVLPAIKILKPTAIHYNDTTGPVSGYTLSVNGSATDNARVSHVYISNNGGPFNELT